MAAEEVAAQKQTITSAYVSAVTVATMLTIRRTHPGPKAQAASSLPEIADEVPSAVPRVETCLSELIGTVATAAETDERHLRIMDKFTWYRCIRCWSTVRCRHGAGLPLTESHIVGGFPSPTLQKLPGQWKALSRVASHGALLRQLPLLAATARVSADFFAVF
jgi:hypothetical protein